MSVMMRRRDRDYGPDKRYDVLVWGSDDRSLVQADNIARKRGYDEIDASPPKTHEDDGETLNLKLAWKTTFADRDRADDEVYDLYKEEGVQIAPDDKATLEALERAKKRRDETP